MYAVLYDMTLKDYKNEKMKLNVWEKIAEELQHFTGCCVQGVGVDKHLYIPTVLLVNHDNYTKEHGLQTRQKSLLYVFVQFVHWDD